MDDDGFIDWHKPLFDEAGVALTIGSVVDKDGYVSHQMDIRSPETIRKLINNAISIGVMFQNPTRRNNGDFQRHYNSWGQPLEPRSTFYMPDGEITNYDASMEPAEGDELWGLM